MNEHPGNAHFVRRDGTYGSVWVRSCNKEHAIEEINVVPLRTCFECQRDPEMWRLCSKHEARDYIIRLEGGMFTSTMFQLL